MNKVVKGAMATAAGVALLLGGAGTFALWTDSESVAAGTIQSGTLSLTSSSTPQWRNIASDVPDAERNIRDISTYRIAPGDKLELTQTLLVDATGDNLRARLSLDESTITGGLKQYVTPVLSVTGTGVSDTSTANAYDIATSAGPNPVTITVVIDFPATVSGTGGQAAELVLSDLGFTLTQLR